MIKTLTDITTAVALSCLAFSSSVHAELAPLTTNDVSAALWANAQRVCPEEYILYDQSIPDAPVKTANQIPEQPIEESWRTPGESPVTSEYMQVLLYVMVQAAQAGTLFQYLSDFHPDSEFSEQPYLDMRQRLQAETDLAKCLMPVGPRFSTSDEFGLPQFAHNVTQDVICAKWHEFSDGILTLDARELTQEVFEDRFDQIHSETMATCEK